LNTSLQKKLRLNASIWLLAANNSGGENGKKILVLYHGWFSINNRQTW